LNHKQVYAVKSSKQFVSNISANISLRFLEVVQKVIYKISLQNLPKRVLQARKMKRRKDKIRESNLLLLCNSTGVDAFDLMYSNNKKQLHEIMEQQTICVGRAGIYVTLTARASIMFYCSISLYSTPTRSI